MRTSTLLSQTCKIILSGTPKTSIPEYWNGEIKWVTPVDITKLNERYIHNTERKITEEGIKNSSAKLLKKNTIIISARGTVGELCITSSEMRCNQSCYALEVFPKIIRPLYLYYILKNLKSTYSQIAHGTVFDTITKTTFDEINIDLPSLDEQDKIIPKLDHLDNKIENLQNQNHILEQTAQAIFQSWFIDFDGVTEFEDSELGKIPKGWSVEKINDICETFGGVTPSTKNPNYWNGQNHWLVQRDLTSSDRMFCVDSERKITDEGLQNCASQMHPENSIFMTSRATIGAFCINKIPVATNQGFIVSRPKNQNHLYYIFLNFRNRVDEFIQEANGSTFLEISRGNFRQLPILVPSPEIIDDFQIKAKLLFENIFNNEEMIVGLTKTRDTLLPKLMSGEIRV